MDGDIFAQVCSWVMVRKGKGKGKGKGKRPCILPHPEIILEHLDRVRSGDDEFVDWLIRREANNYVWVLRLIENQLAEAASWRQVVLQQDQLVLHQDRQLQQQQQELEELRRLLSIHAWGQ